MGQFHAECLTVFNETQKTNEFYLHISHFKDVEFDGSAAIRVSENAKITLPYRTVFGQGSNVVVTDVLLLDVQDGVQPAPLEVLVQYTINGTLSKEKDTVKVDRSGGGGGTSSRVRATFVQSRVLWYKADKLRKLIRRN